MCYGTGLNLVLMATVQIEQLITCGGERGCLCTQSLCHPLRGWNVCCISLNDPVETPACQRHAARCKHKDSYCTPQLHWAIILMQHQALPDDVKTMGPPLQQRSKLLADLILGLFTADVEPVVGSKRKRM